MRHEYTRRRDIGKNQLVAVRRRRFDQISSWEKSAAGWRVLCHLRLAHISSPSTQHSTRSDSRKHSICRCILVCVRSAADPGKRRAGDGMHTNSYVWFYDVEISLAYKLCCALKPFGGFGTFYLPLIGWRLPPEEERKSGTTHADGTERKCENWQIMEIGFSAASVHVILIFFFGSGCVRCRAFDAHLCDLSLCQLSDRYIHVLTSYVAFFVLQFHQCDVWNFWQYAQVSLRLRVHDADFCRQ